jgi:Na+/H+-dicarboxylate symporter
LSSGSVSPNRRVSKPLPLYIRILIGVVIGILVGITLHRQAAPLGDMGMLVIQMLKALATPLIFLAIVDAFLRTRIPARKGATLIALSLLNALVAIAIGLTVANVVRGGERWRGHTGDFTRLIASPPPTAAPAAAGAKKPGDETHPTLNPLENVAKYVPESFIEPFVKNSLISVVLLAVLLGAALRRVKDRAEAGQAEADSGNPAAEPVRNAFGEDQAGIVALEGVVQTLLRAFGQILEWIIQIIPFAVFGIVAKVVGQTGVGVFGILGLFLATVILGLFLHAVVYYSLLLRLVGRTSPRRFYAGALDAIVTALSCGSSLATLPVTLRCLKDNLKVSDDSARLAACVGTNLNHDGIILYEAVTAIFVAQAFGYALTPAQQVTIALASVMAGIGIAGIPEAGLITLPLVLSAAGLPAALVATIIPLILPVDWIIGRCRATTNVLSDMTVAILLDRLHPNIREEGSTT